MEKNRPVALDSMESTVKTRSSRSRLDVKSPRKASVLSPRSSGLKGSILAGHTGPVSDCCVSAEGSEIASVGQDRKLILWTKTNHDESWKIARRWEHHSNWVYSVAMTPKASMIVTGSSDRTIRLARWSDSDERGNLPSRRYSGHRGTVHAVSISADGSRILSGGGDGTVRLWHLATHDAKVFDNQAGAVLCCSMSKDGNLGISGGSDQVVRLWDFRSGHVGGTLSGHQGMVAGCCMDDHPTVVVSVSEDETGIVWDLRTMRELVRLEGHSGLVNGCAMRSDGSEAVTVASGYQSGAIDPCIRLWNTRNGAQIDTLLGHKSYLRCCGMSNDGRVVATGASDSTVWVWSRVNDLYDRLS